MRIDYTLDRALSQYITSTNQNPDFIVMHSEDLKILSDQYRELVNAPSEVKVSKYRDIKIISNDEIKRNTFLISKQYETR